MQLSASGETTEDPDADRITTDSDNCFARANFDQVDVGGLNSSVLALDPDGVGDACQCFDIDLDGRILPAGALPSDPGDVGRLQNELAQETVALDVQELCSTSSDATTFSSPTLDPSACNMSDAVVTDLALRGEGPGINGVCVRNRLPVPADN